MLLPTSALAQQPAYKATGLISRVVTGQPNTSFSMISIEWPPGAGTGRHTHSGGEFGTVLEGSYMAQLGDGEWRRIASGQS